MQRRTLVVILLGVAASLQAQDSPEKAFRYRGSGYVLFGAGACQHRVPAVHISGGGEAFVFRGLSVGGELGYHTFVERYATGFGVGTMTVGYHFVDRDTPKRFDPFVSMGFPGFYATREFGGGAAGSLGGGLTYWFKRKIGLRAEYRIYALAEEGIQTFRIGLSFR